MKNRTGAVRSRMPSVTESLIARMEVTRWNIVTATSEGNLHAGFLLVFKLDG